MSVFSKVDALVVDVDALLHQPQTQHPLLAELRQHLTGFINEQVTASAGLANTLLASVEAMLGLTAATTATTAAAAPASPPAAAATAAAKK